MSNRVLDAIEKNRNNIAKLTDEKRKFLEENMAITFLEHHAYQNAQSRAFASGKLTADEAQICYAALGETTSASNGGWAKDADLATKLVVTRIVGELLDGR